MAKARGSRGSGYLERHQRVVQVASSAEEEAWLSGEEVSGFTPSAFTFAKCVYISTGILCRGILDVSVTMRPENQVEKDIMEGVKQTIADILEYGLELRLDAVMDGEIRPSGVLFMYFKHGETGAKLYEMPGWWSEQFRAQIIVH